MTAFVLTILCFFDTLCVTITASAVPLGAFQHYKPPCLSTAEEYLNGCGSAKSTCAASLNISIPTSVENPRFQMLVCLVIVLSSPLI